VVNTFTRVLILALVLCFSQTEAMAVTISIDPLRTFLFTNNDPWSGNGSVAPSIPIALGDLGISGGDVIQLDRLGAFYDGTYGYGTGIDTLSLQTSTEMIGVFSSSDVLLAPNLLNRVPGAIDAGVPVVTWNTLFGDMATDIPQDFRIANTIVQVPLGANYLFVAAEDIYYSDNSDPDGDYAVRITQLASVPEPSTLLLVFPAFAAFCLLSRRIFAD
jgi:hypothetical protein